METSMMPTPTLMKPLSSVKSEDKNKLVMISLGSNLKVTRASFYTLVAGIIFSIVLAFTSPVWGPVVAVTTLLMWLVAAYNVNCVQVGHCYTWGWVLTTVYLVTVGLALLKVFMVDGDDLNKMMTGKKMGSPVSKRGSRK